MNEPANIRINLSNLMAENEAMTRAWARLTGNRAHQGYEPIVIQPGTNGSEPMLGEDALRYANGEAIRIDPGEHIERPDLPEGWWVLAPTGLSVEEIHACINSAKRGIQRRPDVSVSIPGPSVGPMRFDPNKPLG